MLMLTLAIFYLTKFNIPRFMDLTFQVPMQYCSLQLQNLLSSLDTSSTGYHFCFGSASSFFLELFFCSSPIAYWSPTNLRGLSCSVISFCLFILSMGSSRQKCWIRVLFIEMWTRTKHCIWLKYFQSLSVSLLLSLQLTYWRNQPFFFFFSLCTL